MPCTACGTSSQNKKSYQLYKPKQNTKQNTVYLTPQQLAMLQARRRSCRRTLVFT